MAGKRNATSDINHENWDQEDEPEEAGIFKKAPEDVLKSRVIKTAKRRNPIHSSEGGAKNVFQSFSGFTKTAPPANAAFGFLSNLKPADSPKVNGTSEKPEAASTTKQDQNKTSIPNDSVKVNDDAKLSDEQYYSKLKGLNESVSNWIKTHVDANPLINLQPIFKDYEKYFADLEKEKSNSQTENKDSSISNFVFKAADKVPDKTPSKDFVFKPSDVNPSTSKALFSFSTSTDTNGTESGYKAGVGSSESPKFSFGGCSSTGTTTTTTDALKFSFGGATNSVDASKFPFGSTSNAKFSFGSMNSTPFTFSNVSKPPSEDTNAKKDAEEDEDSPPKVEVVPVKEEGYVYSIRCKVFVKKEDGSFGDRGVGNLYLKPVPNSEKVQLIVRADTNLGNLLANFILSESIPMQRKGKNNVMLVCVPTPEAKPPPVPILFRVKTAEDADGLLETLQKYKK